jgi:hypothetical protein
MFMKYFYYMFCLGYMIYRPAACVVTFDLLCIYVFAALAQNSKSGKMRTAGIR